jgi:hypothetical protein
MMVLHAYDGSKEATTFLAARRSLSDLSDSPIAVLAPARAASVNEPRKIAAENN